MRQTLKSYLRRLTNLTARNRSLLLTTLPAEQFLDVQDLDFLDGKPSFDVIAQLIGQKKIIALCDVLDPRYERVNTVSQRLRRIARTERFIQEERGAEDLFVGYPMVRGQFADGTVVRGPLVFFPVTLAIEKQKWVLRRRPEPVTLNRSFLLAYSHFNEVKLSDELLEKTFGEATTERDALTFRTQLYDFLKESPLELNFNPDLFSPHLLPVERLTKSDLEQLERPGELKLYPQAVLGIFPQAGSYLAPDYEELILRAEVSGERRAEREQKIEDSGQSVAEREQSVAERGVEGRPVNSEEEIQPESESNLFSNLLSPLSSPLSPLSSPLPPPSSLLTTKESDTLAPFAVDASQEAAILRIKGGESLVIQGPPGTGKSQVIANLMADFAARGKRVLLVCQKRAALDTVYARLRQVGMGEFAALIHDVRHDRAPLYAQLAGQIDRLDDYQRQNQSLDAIFMERDFTQTSRRIEQISSQLQEFKDALFDESICGISAKELYLTSDPQGPRIDLGEHYAAFRFGEFEDFLRRLGQYEEYENLLNTSPWHPDRINFAPLAFQDVPKIEAALTDIPAFVGHLQQVTETLLGKSLSWAECVAIHEGRAQWAELLKRLNTEAIWGYFQKLLHGQMPAGTAQWLDEQGAELEGLFRQGIVGASVKRDGLSSFQQAVQAGIEARRSVVGWWFFREKEALRSEAARYGLTVSLPDLQKLSTLVENRMSWEKGLVDIERKTTTRLLFEDPTVSQANFQALNANYSQAQQAVKLLGKKSGTAYQLALQFPALTDFRRMVTQLLEAVGVIPEHQQIWRNYLTDNQIEASIQGKTSVFQFIQSIRQDFDLLHEADGLKGQFSRVEWTVVQNLSSAKDQRVAIFLNSLRLAWLDALEARYPALRAVSGLRMNQWETELQEAIQRKQALSRDILGLHLREQTYRNVERNRLQNVVTYRDLKHQVTKKRSLWAVRRLLSERSDEIFQLVPCWLASPESVSALFPLEKMFDVVIFDEASQCFAEQGIPALFRGRQVVIAGDRQQLQPSDLYRVRFEADEASDNPDLEVDSLLDLAARYLPQVQLNGHYRSRSLDLIQFSNEYFYQNTLRLLPDFAEINQRQPAIEYRHVAGVWQDQQNEAEARAVLELLHELAINSPEKSVGIVTFNFRQQQLIQDLVESESLNWDTGTEGRERQEPLFIKNIENVQGDERDVIIFSVGYAPDVRGRISVQFGSLNTRGGENRLNVAVTRARQRVYVVCSLWPEQLGVDSTLNEGPRVLRRYLDYARRVSEGHFRPQPPPQPAFRTGWLLRNKLVSGAEKKPGKPPEGETILTPELPFADLTAKRGEAYTGLLLTDDELYFQSLSPKEAHAYLPLTLRAKGWPVERRWSREWWAGRGL
ncbi:MAG: AAA domain-containing protein [Cytophagaceae bacterium]|nr:AAA domain-containing protein [Cytophagaceae bacterium]